MAPETPTTLVEQHTIPGATLAVCSANGTVTRGIGWPDRTQTTRLDTNARFPVYSIAKTMIATIILQLAEETAFALDTPLRELVDPASSAWLDPAITVRQTLNHTSGLPDYGPLPAYRDALRAHPEHPWNDEAYLACARDQGLRFRPGSGWAYSNIGYLLLRQAIEFATGDSLARAVAERIAAPFGLARTAVVTDLDGMRDLTPGFSTALADNDEETDIICRYHPGWVAHGLVASTAADVARFLFVLLSGAILAPASLDTMLTPVRVPLERHPLFREPSYGLGVMLDPAAIGGMLVGHGGGGPGFSLGVLGIRSDGQVVVAAGMANSDRGDIGLELAFRELRRMTNG